MPAFTAQALIDRAAAIADMHDSFVTTNQWLAWLNTEIRALDIFMARAGWVLPAATVATDTSAPYGFTIAAETLAIVGVWEEINGRYRLLRPMHPVEFQQQNATTGVATGAAQNYMVTNTPSADTLTVSLFPRPLSGTYVIYSIPVSTLAASTSTSLYYPMGFEERLVLGMARKALVKEESDIGAISVLIQEQDQRIEEACWSRMLGEAPSVRNIDPQTRGWTMFPEWPAPARWHWV